MNVQEALETHPLESLEASEVMLVKFGPRKVANRGHAIWNQDGILESWTTRKSRVHWISFSQAVQR